MLTCCNTARGRLACGLGGVLIAALALACLWAFSPAVTAGDDPPVLRGPKASCPAPLPPLPPEPEPPLPPKTGLVTGAAPAMPRVPPLARETDKAPPPPPFVEKAPPPGPITPVVGRDVSPPAPPQAQLDGQNIKQLVAQLAEIRADRAKLDEKERQTIQTIKKKYQEQKQALTQLEGELRQLGINCEERTAGWTPPPPPAR